MQISQFKDGTLETRIFSAPTDKLIQRLKDEHAAALDRGAIDIRQMEVDADRQKAIIAKLPKTADGIPIVPGMQIWWKSVVEWRMTIVSSIAISSLGHHIWLEGGGWLRPEVCYGTLAAVEASNKGMQKS